MKDTIIRIHMKENKKGSSRVESSQQAGRVQVMVESSRLIVESQVKSSQEGVESRVESSFFSSSSSRVESSRVESSRVESLQHCLFLKCLARCSRISESVHDSI